MNNEASAEPVKTPGQPPVHVAPAGDSLDDAWERIVNQMVAAESIAALTRELALQSQLCVRNESLWTLRVERESLNQAAAREKLQVALQAALGEPALRLAVELGAVIDTPARRNSAALVECQRTAELLIQNDPFVQNMIREWGARIVPGSIKSISS